MQDYYDPDALMIDELPQPYRRVVHVLERIVEDAILVAASREARGEQSEPCMDDGFLPAAPVETCVVDAFASVPAGDASATLAPLSALVASAGDYVLALGPGASLGTLHVVHASAAAMAGSVPQIAGATSALADERAVALDAVVLAEHAGAILVAACSSKAIVVGVARVTQGAVAWKPAYTAAVPSSMSGGVWRGVQLSADARYLVAATVGPGCSATALWQLRLTPDELAAGPSASADLGEPAYVCRAPASGTPSGAVAGHATMAAEALETEQRVGGAPACFLYKLQAKRAVSVRSVVLWTFGSSCYQLDVVPVEGAASGAPPSTLKRSVALTLPHALRTWAVCTAPLRASALSLVHALQQPAGELAAFWLSDDSLLVLDMVTGRQVLRRAGCSVNPRMTFAHGGRWLHFSMGDQSYGVDVAVTGGAAAVERKMLRASAPATQAAPFLCTDVVLEVHRSENVKIISERAGEAVGRVRVRAFGERTASRVLTTDAGAAVLWFFVARTAGAAGTMGAGGAAPADVEVSLQVSSLSIVSMLQTCFTEIAAANPELRSMQGGGAGVVERAVRLLDANSERDGHAQAPPQSAAASGRRGDSASFAAESERSGTAASSRRLGTASRASASRDQMSTISGGSARASRQSSSRMSAVSDGSSSTQTSRALTESAREVVQVARAMPAYDPDSRVQRRLVLRSAEKQLRATRVARRTEALAATLKQGSSSSGSAAGASGSANART